MTWETMTTNFGTTLTVAYPPAPGAFGATITHNGDGTFDIATDAPAWGGPEADGFMSAPTIGREVSGFTGTLRQAQALGRRLATEAAAELALQRPRR